MEVRLGSTTGTLIGTLTTTSTGGWSPNLQEQSISLENATGVQNIYIVFKGYVGVGSFDWFKFNEGQYNLNRPYAVCTRSVFYISI